MAVSGFSRAPASGRAVAEAAHQALGGQRRIQRVWNPDESAHVDVLLCENAPCEGWTTHTTLSLHLQANLVNGNDIRVELCGMAGVEVETFPRVLAEAGFMMAAEGWFAAPGVLFADLVGQHVEGTTVPHLLWFPPPWQALGRVAIEAHSDVHWLLGFPVSEAERVFFLDEGFDALETLFDSQKVEYFDLFRASVC